MASVLTRFLTTLSPPPFVNLVEYDGLEYKWKMFTFRPALFKVELYLLIGLVFYIIFSRLGVAKNSNMSRRWLQVHLPIYEQQFSKPQSSGGLISDGYTDFFNFSTGRRNVASLHTVFTLRPRHDFFQWAFQTLRSFVDLYYQAKDDIQLDFKLAPRLLTHDFVWAVVAKEELRSIKDERWDLTFTKSSENPALPPSLSVMSEFADITDNMFKPSGNFSLLTMLQDPKILPYFRSLTVTDQPRQRPLGPIPAGGREKHVILSLIAPSPSHAADTVDFVTAMFNFIDLLSKVNLRPETKAKLKKTREDVDKELRADVEKEKKEEISQAAEDKKAAKRKAEEERIAKLSAAEQQKILEKERKKNMRKNQAKIVRK
ncbi:hypothetical protein AMATHDRAFT_73876 [Amanita thiersii Skay4041]|uniref:DUF1682-domain-containing protein n=1 Tax=Amanita thiersii Skay4041 TaxID=703135 RepID=A0A2A9NY13_9AGAR|nr:hypothetical protein AMATHDRAFT_73876 [Amanita thiersii Skay4041]